MAENADEEHLDIPNNTPLENSSEETTLAEDTATIIQNQEAENMEVHHHPDLHHKPKKWKEYFLEFLMIFLAVTLGFFAENLRENISKHEREEKLMKMLIEDLKADINKLDSSIYFNNLKERNLDTLKNYVIATADKKLSDTA